MNEQPQPAGSSPVERPVRPQRWTTPSASPSEHGGFVAYVDHLEAVRAAVAAERKRCLQIIEAHQVPVGNSAAGEMAAEWTMDALREIRDAIRGA